MTLEFMWAECDHGRLHTHMIRLQDEYRKDNWCVGPQKVPVRYEEIESEYVDVLGDEMTEWVSRYVTGWTPIGGEDGTD